MIGLVLASIYASVLVLFEKEGPRIFQRAANFLFWWYLSIAWIVGTLFFLIAFGGITLAMLGSSFPATLLGSIAGGILGAFLFAIILLLYLFEIIGAHLLRTSVEKKGDAWIWHNGRLISGFLLIVIALFFTI